MKFIRRRPRACLLALAATALGGATFTTGARETHAMEANGDWAAPRGDFSVLTYNVKGLPQPIAFGRTQMLERIGLRLAAMRRRGRQPSVVVLQEAFTPEARRIAELSGYAHVIDGPARETTNPVAASAGMDRQRSWFLGERQDPQLDSGLILLSDLPVISVRRSAFPRAACAGFDCLANKGVLLVTLEMEDGSRIAVATTHFNSRGASWAPIPDTQSAYKAQADYLAQFLSREWDGTVPLVVAGDFNQGQRPYRMEVLPAAIRSLAPTRRVSEALSFSREASLVPDADRRDAKWIVERARDMQFLVPGAEKALIPVAASVPFGSEAGGESLSDHFGFVVNYAIEREPSDAASRGDNAA